MPDNRVKTAKLVIGIISIVLFFIIMLQSCAVGFINTIEANVDSGAGAGAFLGFCMLIGGIVGITTRRSRGGGLTAGLFYIFGALIGLTGLGRYGDLPIWSVLSLFFGLFFIIGTFGCGVFKRWWFWVIVAVIAFFVFAAAVASGGQTQDASATQSTQIPAQPAVPQEDSPQKTEAPVLTQEEAETPAVPQEEAPAVGARLNPVPLGTPLTGTFTKYREELSFTLTITELVRGQEALDIAISANRYNDDVPEGYDLVLCKVEYTLLQYTDEDSYLCSPSSFRFYNGDYGQVSESVSVAGLDRLHAELYEGASTSGWMYTVVSPTDATPYVCYEKEFWFALY